MATPSLSHNGFALSADAQDLLFREAHTIQSFTDAPVTAADVEAVWDMVRWGPTAMNTSPLRLLVIEDRAERERLVSHVFDKNQAKTLVAPVTIVAAFDPNFHTELPRLAPHMTGMREVFEPQEGLRQGMARDNAWLQVGYLIVGLRAAGLHVGPLTGFDALSVDGEFLRERGWHSFMVLNVGREPAEREDVPQPVMHPRQMRLAFNEIAISL